MIFLGVCSAWLWSFCHWEPFQKGTIVSLCRWLISLTSVLVGYLLTWPPGSTVPASLFIAQLLHMEPGKPPIFFSTSSKGLRNYGMEDRLLPKHSIPWSFFAIIGDIPASSHSQKSPTKMPASKWACRYHNLATFQLVGRCHSPLAYRYCNLCKLFLGVSTSWQKECPEGEGAGRISSPWILTPNDPYSSPSMGGLLIPAVVGAMARVATFSIWP